MRNNKICFFTDKKLDKKLIFRLPDEGVSEGRFSVINMSNYGHVSDILLFVHNAPDLSYGKIHHLATVEFSSLAENTCHFKNRINWKNVNRKIIFEKNRDELAFLGQWYFSLTKKNLSEEIQKRVSAKNFDAISKLIL